MQREMYKKENYNIGYYNITFFLLFTTYSTFNTNSSITILSTDISMLYIRFKLTS